MTQIQDLQEYVVGALEVVEFRLVRSREEIADDEKTFPPAMAHQIFGENESIFGYKDLSVKLYYAAGNLQTYVALSYGKKIEDDRNHTGFKADDVLGTIADKFPDGCYYTDLDEFLKIVDKAEQFQPIGEKVHQVLVKNEAGDERCFEFYYCDLETPKFKPFFSRLQTFILWFVDAATYIDIDDPQWNYFICYEKFKNSNGNTQYATIGYTTVYKYYAYPENARPRISQMLILPPFQKHGIGTNFIKTIYNHYKKDDAVIDITVEDPSEDFTRIRNYVDASLCKSLKCFDSKLIKDGFTEGMVKEARSTFKINQKQCRIVYEILRLFHTNIHDDSDYKKYRLSVKNRLNAPYYKQIRDMKKMEKAKIDTQFMKASLPTQEERFEQLIQEYNDVEKQYFKIVEKLKERTFAVQI